MDSFSKRWSIARVEVLRHPNRLAFATRDSLIRWLGTEAMEVDPALATFVTMLTGTTVSLLFVWWTRTELTRRAALALLPAGLCYGLSYVLLFEAFYPAGWS